MITLYIIFIIILFVDVLFYIPLKFHILISKDEFAIYFFNIPLVLISSQKKINRLKNKIPPIDFKNIDTADIKYIEAINLEKLYINFDMHNLNYQFYPFLYPFLGSLLIYTFDFLLYLNKYASSLLYSSFGIPYTNAI